MKLEVIPASQLTADHVAAWSRLQRSDPSLANPFFRPEFTQAVDAVRGGIEVAIWEKGGQAIGFLPFQRNGRGIGRPVGSPTNDFQGAIARADVAWSPQDFVRRAGLWAWQFDHLVAAQSEFAPFQYIHAKSPYINLSQGYGHYLASKSKNFRTHLKRAECRASKLGDLRLELDSTDRGTLAKLIEWKCDKCRRTRVPNTFARDWPAKVLDYILANPSEYFSGVLVSLYIGDRLVSVEFALRSGKVLHEWHSAYNIELAMCSPGTIMENQLDQQAHLLGITRIDFGKGDEQYKKRFATGYDLLAEGAVHVRPLHGLAYRTLYRAKDRLRLTPLRRPARRVRRWMSSTRMWLGLAE